MNSSNDSIKPGTRAGHPTFRTLVVASALIPALVPAGVLLGALATSPKGCALFTLVALGVGSAVAIKITQEVAPLSGNRLHLTFVLLPVAVSLVALPLDWAAPDLSLMAHCTLVWYAGCHATWSVRKAMVMRTTRDTNPEPVSGSPLAAIVVGACSVGIVLGAACGRQVTSPLAIEGLIVLCYLTYGVGQCTMQAHRYHIVQKRLDGATGIHRLDRDAACDYLSDAHMLTSRERQVFRIIAQGHRPLYVAAHLAISEATARAHVRNIYAKFGVNNYEGMLGLVQSAMDGVTTEELVRARTNPMPAQGRKRKY